MPPAVFSAPAVTAALRNAEQAANDLTSAADSLAAVGAGGDETEVIAAFVVYGGALAQYFASLDVLVQAIDSAISPATITDAAERAAAEDLAAMLARRMADYFLASTIIDNVPLLAFFLKIFGLMEWRYRPEDESNSLSRDYVEKRLYLERIETLISDPAEQFELAHGWGTNAFDPTDLFKIYEGFYDIEEAITIGVIDGDPYLEHGIFLVRRNSSVSPAALDATVSASIDLANEGRVTLNEQWGVTLSSDLGFTGGAGLRVVPTFSVELLPFEGEVDGRLRLFANRNEDARPFDLFAEGGLLNLSVNDTALGTGLVVKWDVAEGKAAVIPLFFAEISGAVVRIGSSGADGFIASLLASAEIEGQFDLGLEWETENGLRIKASGGIEIALPIHKSLAVVEFQTLYLVLTIQNDGTLSLETSTALTGKLGPLAVAIERLGAQLDLGFAGDTSADFGLFDFDLGFKPPNGVGLALDAGVVKGGGYLYFDFDKEEYAGILELDLSGIVSVKAIGLITTRLPDGSQGFSLLVIITAEFGSPIQLGLGFTLSGVGGLLGVSRTMRLEVIATGIRDGGINSIMFPQNVIENAPRIISDLKKYFPVEKDTFLIGPMVKIGWGTPNLITVSLGIIIEIPGNIAILGVLKVVLPDEEAALIVIQVNFMGALEFDKKRLWFFAALFESRVLFITLEGEMGLLVGWGDDANFLVSVGGFHPAFNPPALPFGAIARIAISILNTNFARIRVEGYFAVTSNSVQFGAAVELFFGVSAFNIDGHLAFDALFRFSPFYFIISISSSLSVKVFGVGLFSVRMRGSLEGPTPWHVEGTGSISLLFFDIDVDFSHTWGNEAETTLPPIAVMPLLKGEFQKLENWRAVLPASNQLLVSLRSFEQGAADLVLHPVGSLHVSQRAVPLELTIDKVGNQKPSDANKFEVTVDTTGGIGEHGDVDESFAVGQYLDKSDSELLNAKSFEPMKGGVEVSVKGEQYRAPLAVKRVVRYEEIIVDTHYRRFVRPFFALIGSLFGLFLNGNAVSQSALSQKQQQQLKPFAETMTVSQPQYGVAHVADNTAFSEEAVNFSSQAQAREFMQQQIADDGNLAQELHVIPQVEMQR